MIRATLLMAAAVFLFPERAQAQRAMGGTICACPGMAKPLGNAPNCDVACNGARSGGGGGGGAMRGAALQLGTHIGESFRRSQAEKAERARQAAQQLEIDRQRRQEQQRIEDEARKNRLLSGMQGVEDTGELTLMMGDDEPPIPESRISVVARARDRHNQEAAQRREALARLEGKPEAKWCKLHLPQALAMPLRTAGEERVYAGMLEKFVRDRSEWDKRCGGPSAEGPTPLDKDLAALQRFDKPKLVAVTGAAPAAAPSVTSAPEPAPAAPALQVGGMTLMSEEDLPRAAPKKTPEPEPAPVVEAPAQAPPPEPQRKGWIAESVDAPAPHVVEAGTPGMPPPDASPVFPAAVIAGKDAISPLSFAAAPAAPGAYAFMSRPAAAAPSRGTEKPKFDLMMFSKGLATVENGVSLAAASVKVLYNLGAASGETGESQTMLVFEKDEKDKGTFETEKGVATLPAGSIEWKELTAESVGPNRWLRPASAAGGKR